MFKVEENFLFFFTIYKFDDIICTICPPINLIEPALFQLRSNLVSKPTFFCF